MHAVHRELHIPIPVPLISSKLIIWIRLNSYMLFPENHIGLLNNIILAAILVCKETQLQT